jgi:hypothetical protein
MLEAFALLGALVAIPALIGGASIANGMALVYLWGWFISPLGLPGLSLSHAIGISTLISFVTYQYTKEPKEVKQQVAVEFLTILFRPLFAFFFGWMVQHFM